VLMRLSSFTTRAKAAQPTTSITMMALVLWWPCLIRPAISSSSSFAVATENGTYEYSIFGQVAASDPNHPNPYLFTGRRFDTETGLYYYRDRHYNPYIGRFMQTDPVGYGYGYCSNNPIGCVDPSGLLSICFYDPDEIVEDPNSPYYGQSLLGEAANDFGKYAFSMRSLDPELSDTEWIIAILEALVNGGLEITDVYFFDHSHVTVDEYDRITDVKALEFGGEVVPISNEQQFWGDLGNAVPEGATIHFRQCAVGFKAWDDIGKEENSSHLANLASWTGRDVTGAALEVTWVQIELGKPGTLDRPDYYFHVLYKAYHEDEVIRVKEVWCNDTGPGPRPY